MPIPLPEWFTSGEAGGAAASVDSPLGLGAGFSGAAPGLKVRAALVIRAALLVAPLNGSGPDSGAGLVAFGHAAVFLGWAGVARLVAISLVFVAVLLDITWLGVAREEASDEVMDP